MAIPRCACGRQLNAITLPTGACIQCAGPRCQEPDCDRPTSRAGRKYCSRTCAVAARKRQSARDTQALGPTPSNGICKQCHRNPIKPKRKYFCSDACKIDAMAVQYRNALRRATDARKRKSYERLVQRIREELRALSDDGRLSESALLRLVLEHRAQARQNERTRRSYYRRIAA